MLQELLTDFCKTNELLALLIDYKGDLNNNQQ